MYKPLILTGQEPNKNQTNKQTNKTQIIFFWTEKRWCAKPVLQQKWSIVSRHQTPWLRFKGGPEIRWVKIVQGEKEIEDLSLSRSLGGELWRFLIFFLAQRGFWIGRGDQMRGRETTIYDWLILTVNGLFKLLFFLVGEKIYSFLTFFFSFSQPILV